MKFIRISPSEVINLEQVARIETYIAQDIRYLTIHFIGGASYRCTEDESEQLMAHVKPMTDAMKASVS